MHISKRCLVIGMIYLITRKLISYPFKKIIQLGKFLIGRSK